MKFNEIGRESILWQNAVLSKDFDSSFILERLSDFLQLVGATIIGTLTQFDTFLNALKIAMF